MEGSENTSEFIQELKNQALSSTADEGGPRTWSDKDGTVYEWDADKQGWFPKVDEDFIAAYQMNYGFTAPEEKDVEVQASSVGGSSTAAARTPQPVAGGTTGEANKVTKKDNDAVESKEKDSEEKGKKRKVKEEPVWFEMDQKKNTNVYVSGLPPETTEDEYVEMMSKYGIIMEDPDTNTLKIKLYKDENGKPKGDGRCCYLKIESVALAIEMLDESDYKGSTLHVEQAEFHLKGSFNPSLKKKKKKKKRKPGKGQDKLLDWVDRDVKKPKNERVVIIRNMFNIKDFERLPPLILELRNDLRKECDKYGDVRKIIVFDRNAEGICSVSFKEHESADACITVMNGRWFAGRQLVAGKWDGVTNFNVQESDKDVEDRMKNWENYLLGDEEEANKTTIPPKTTTTKAES